MAPILLPSLLTRRFRQAYQAERPPETRVDDASPAQLLQSRCRGMTDHSFARRTFLQTAVAAASARVMVGLPRAAQTRRRDGESAPGAPPPSAVKLGVASYSLRKFPRDRAIAMIRALGTPYVNLKSVHLDYGATPGEFTAARQEMQAAGLQIVGGGTITFDVDTDDGVERYFAYARAAGMPLMVSTCEGPMLPRIERFAKQYDIKVALHNHGPEDTHFPSPYDVLRAVKGMDPRMGLCIDVGHTVRTGTDVVKAVADAGPRLLDMHVKDLRDLTNKDSQCIVGEGAIPFPALFRQLTRQGYAGYVNLEYEIDVDDPLPGMKQSFAYMRGVLAGLGVPPARA
jgi:sugar phosphate isomerase/epimerase